MKKIYILLILVLASSLISAQNKDTQVADKLFKKFEFISAAESYLKLVASNKADELIEVIEDFFKQNSMPLGVTARFSNGETHYSKI